MDAQHIDKPAASKPHWLRKEAFEELLRNCGGVPKCAMTGETENLTVDHIVPRWEGGTDDVSNLQFLTALMNAKKGIRPDSHWQQSFYWDQTPNFDALRGAQRILFQEINEQAEWFGQPISQIARSLYLNAWVVGAGKTLGIASAAWAVNRVIRETWRAAPRADCVLIITKEQAIRDQIANDLVEDIPRYGILPQAPRVGVVTRGWQFQETEWLGQHDAIVTCIHQLWEQGEGTSRQHLAELLARFPVIAFDELHFATDQVNRLVEAASTSICFGFTGTPIDSAGNLLGRMVGLTVYGYDQANRVDRGLKWLDNNPELFREFVREIGITEARLIEYGERTTTQDASKEGYGKNIEPAKSVVRGVIEEMKRRDQLVVEVETIAPHRDPAGTEKAGLYPSHGMVVCDSIAAAKELCRNTNELFERDPYNYPIAEGWRAEVVHTDALDGEGGRLVGKPLTQNHPWLRAKGQGYRLDAKCARLLFVVGIGREGVNNPPCGPVGVAASLGSVVEWVQRALGRQLRAVVARRNGTLLVPPAPLDTVQIITHVAFGNADTIRRAIDFVCEMEDQLKELPRIEELLEGDVRTTEEIQRGVLLSAKEKLDIAGRLGEFDLQGKPVDAEIVIADTAGLDDGPRVDRIRDWATKVRNDPHAARQEIRLNVAIRPVPIVMHEDVKHEPSDADLERHLKIHHPALAVNHVPVQPEVRGFAEALYTEHAMRFHLPPLTSNDHIESIRRELARRVKSNLGRYFAGDAQRIHQLVGGAVKQKLAVPAVESARNDSDWDTPQVHALLRRPDIQGEIQGWVTGRLIEEGYCPALAALRDPDATRVP